MQVHGTCCLTAVLTCARCMCALRAPGWAPAVICSGHNSAKSRHHACTPCVRRTRWKKSSATVGAQGDLGDEGGSMSTDTTGALPCFVSLSRRAEAYAVVCWCWLPTAACQLCWVMRTCLTWPCRPSFLNCLKLSLLATMLHSRLAHDSQPVVVPALQVHGQGPGQRKRGAGPAGGKLLGRHHVFMLHASMQAHTRCCAFNAALPIR